MSVLPGVVLLGALLGIDWMTQYGLYQSLPPVYTQHIGMQMAAHLSERAA